MNLLDLTGGMILSDSVAYRLILKRYRTVLLAWHSNLIYLYYRAQCPIPGQEHR